MKRVFRKLSVLVLLILAVTSIISFGACSCNQTDDGSNMEILTVNQAVISLKPYQTFSVIATWTGEGELTWTSDDQSVATVDNGLITAKKVGQTIITVSGGKQTKKCYVSVLPDQEVPSVSVLNVENDIVQLNVEDEYNLNVSVNFDGQKVDAKLIFRSTDDKIISVDENGKITAKSIGEAFVFIGGTWREFDENSINTAIKVVVKTKVSFSVLALEPEIYAVSTLDGEKFVQQTNIIPRLVIENTEYTKGFAYISSDPSVASVDKNGLVTGKKVGKTQITCYYQYGAEQLYASTSVEVLPIVREKHLSTPLTLELSNSPTASALNSIFKDGKQTIKIYDVTEKQQQVKINEQDKTIVNDELLVTGERIWEVHNDAYAYRVNVLVADYVLTTAERLKEVLPVIERDAYIILGNNITNVGDYSGWNTFSGTLDGMGYTISDVNIKDRGFFGLLTAGATIKNLAVSNVTLKGASGVFGVQADSATIDNVSVCITGVESTDTIPCGGLVFQVGGTLNVKNTLVYVTGVKDMNFGAVVGAWWSGGCEITNSYFITDGTPFGKVYQTGSISNYNEKGVMENAKGAWSYVYPTIENFEQELVKQDTKINLVGFNREFWKVSDGRIPTFNSDISFKVLLSKQVDGEKTGGETFYFSKNVTLPTGYAKNNVQDGYYIVKLPNEVSGEITNVFIGANEVTDYELVSSENTVKIPVSALSEVICGPNNLLVVTDKDTYKCAVTVADYVMESSDDIQAVLNAITGKEYIVLGANVSWDSAKIFDRTVNTNFNGTFDGKGYVINNFRQNRSLFNTLQPDAIIKNVAILNVSHYGYNRGTLAGDISRDILLENVAVTVTVSGGSFGLFGRLAVSGGPVTLKNTIVAFEYQNATIANSYKEGAELIMENSYIVSSKLPFNSDLGSADTKGVYKTAVNATCLDYKALKKKSNDLSGFDKTYWSFDEFNNLLFGNKVVFGTKEWNDLIDSSVGDYDGWIPEESL